MYRKTHIDWLELTQLKVKDEDSQHRSGSAVISEVPILYILTEVASRFYKVFLPRELIKINNNNSSSLKEIKLNSMSNQ